MCSNADETINYFVSECIKLTQKETKRTDDQIDRSIHWEICRTKRITVATKWYRHEREADVENENCKVFQDFTVQTYHVITSRRPDLIIVDKERNECQIIDFALPYNARAYDKEEEKVDKYLVKETEESVKYENEGSCSKNWSFENQRLENIGIETKIIELQEMVLLYGRTL